MWLLKQDEINLITLLGGLWYYTYPSWSYLDGMYSYAPFYSLYTSLLFSSNITSTATDILNQLDLLYTHCLDSSTGLLHHGYDASLTAVWADKVTGSSPWVWGRSMGWYLLGLVDLLENWTGSRQGTEYLRLLDRYRTLVGAVVKVQDQGSGGWWQIMTEGGREGNYIESSATAIFVSVILRGLRLGLLVNSPMVASCKNEIIPNEKSKVNGTTNLTHSAEQGYTWLVNNAIVKDTNDTLGWNRTVAVCSLNSTASYDVCFPIYFHSRLSVFERVTDMTCSIM